MFRVSGPQGLVFRVSSLVLRVSGPQGLVFRVSGPQGLAFRVSRLVLSAWYYGVIVLVHPKRK